MGGVVDRVGLAAGFDSAGIAWRELDDEERADYAVDGVQPSAICWPASYQEAAQALAVVDQLGLAISPRGAGTKIVLGNPPRACDVIVSTERLNKVVDYAPANLTVTVEAGISLAALQARLAEGGQFLALDPPHADRSTIGGIVAANASGPRRFGLGSARDLVIGTQAATTIGTLTKAGGRVVKNVAGYDLNKLYIGSLGTLVLVVEVTFKVTPRPSAQTTVIGRFARADQLGQAVQTITRSPLMPTAIDLLNARATADLGLTGLPDPRGGYLLATLGTAPGRAVFRQRDDLRKIYQAVGAADIADIAGDESERFWTSVAERAALAEGPNAVRAKVSVPTARVPDVLRTAEEGRVRFGDDLAIGGRAGSGVLYLNWTVPDAATVNGQLTATAANLQELRGICQRLGGSLVVEACPRVLKDHLDVWGDVGSSMGIMRRLKAALDPHAVMNPGRFVGGI
jgi:glycolate oxidase FAD binding subunit